MTMRLSCALGIALLGICIAHPPSEPAPAFTVGRDQRIGKPIPKWRGALIIPSGSDRVEDASLTVYSDRGAVEPIRFDIEGAVRIQVNDSLSWRDGTIAAAIVAWKGSGERAALVAIRNERGAGLKLIRTNPFEPLRIARSSDGNIWVFGQNIADGIEAGIQNDHPVLRVYTPDGTFAGSHVMASSLSRTRLIPVGASAKSGETQMLASQDRIGIYIAQLRQWTEVSTTDGVVLGSWNLPLPLIQAGGKAYQLSPTGLGFTASNRLFAYFMNKNAPDYKGLGYYELDREARQWRRVQGMNTGRYSMLWGAEGDRLLVSTGASEYGWVIPE